MLSRRGATQVWNNVRTAAGGISRRRFLGTVGLSGAAAFLSACATRATGGTGGYTAWLPQPTLAALTPANGAFQLPPLPYDYSALEPFIDTRTMQIHHDRHHQGYVNNLNAALENYPEWQGKDVVTLLTSLDQIPEAIRTTVRNNGGGHLNHTIFWNIMIPGGGGAPPAGDLANAITSSIGGFATFQDQFNQAASGVFGSGWAWLVMDYRGTLSIMGTPNQDSPYVQGYYPLMGLDVWEHAYYLKYQNKRGDYVGAWWNTINWDAVAARYAEGFAAVGA